MNERDHCPSSTPIRPEDLRRFTDDMPEGINVVPEVLPCEMDRGHPGNHVYCVQAQATHAPKEPVSEVYWWAAWQGTGEQQPYQIAIMEPCPETFFEEGEDEKSWCCLPLGHHGPHGPGRGPDET